MKAMRNRYVLVLVALLSAVVLTGDRPAYSNGEFTILLTNDDGYTSPGLKALVEAFAPIAHVVVSAPATQKNGSSGAITYRDPIYIRRVKIVEGVESYAVSAMPATAARVGLESVLNRKPDLVISGINSGPNLGSSILVSGTVGAARQAALLGVPAIAVSRGGRADYNQVAALTRKIVEALRAADMIKPGLLLNINVPAGEVRGVRVVRQSMVRSTENYEKRTSPRGQDYLWSRWRPAKDSDDGTDIGSFNKGYATITPLVVDQTASAKMGPLKDLKLSTKNK